MESELIFSDEKMLDVDNCGKWVSKRNFKVESFLRKQLRQADSGFARYYETCVLERKGALLLRNVILTDQAIHFTENPPKNFNLSIPLSDIQDVCQVADRKTLVKGGNNNSYICQHVRVVYKVEPKARKSFPDKQQPEPKVHPVIPDFKNRASSSSDFRSDWSQWSDWALFTTASDPDTSVVLSDISRQSSSLDRPYIPMSIYYAYEPIVTPPSPTWTRNAVSKSSSMGRLFQNSNINCGSSTSEESIQITSSSSESGSLTVVSDYQESRTSTRASRRSDSNSTRGDNKSRTDYSKLDYGRESPIVKKGLPKTDYKRSRGLASRGVVDSRANFLLGQRPSWHQNGEDGKSETEQRGKDGQEQLDKRRPRSVDISQLSNLKNKLLHKVFGLGNGKDVPLRSNPHQGSTPELSGVNNKKELDDTKGERVLGDDSRDIRILNFYLYQPNSALLNELFLFWSRHSLNCAFFAKDGTDSIEEWVDVNFESSQSLRAAEKIFDKLSLAWSPFDSSNWTNYGQPPLIFSLLLSKLGILHRALKKYDHLKRLCWKNWHLLANLLGVLRRCTTRFDLIDEDDMEDEDAFLDRVSAFSVLMDIFRLLYEGCGACWLTLQSNAVSLNNNNNNNNSNDNYNRENPNKMQIFASEEVPANLPEVTKFLVKSIFGCSIIPHPGIAGGKEMAEIISSPQKFASARWFYYPDSKAIKLITMGHNASVALLHEILSVVHFSSKEKDNERAKFMSYLQNSRMEAYVKLSVTQVINLLWSNGPPIAPSQAVLLYRHISVLKTLLDTVPSVKSFVQSTYCEEFRYFVHEKSANKKIPDRYFLKPKLLATCYELRQEIIGK